MKLIDLYLPLAIGYNLKALEGVVYFNDEDLGTLLHERLDNLSKSLNQLGIADRVQIEMQNMMNQLTDKKIEVKVVEVKDKIKIWKNRINEAMSLKQLIEIITDSNLNLEKLNKGPKAIIKTTWEKLPIRDRDDLADASKCLLVGLWTPALMITMRAIESCVRNYYKNTLGKDPLSTSGKSMNWGAMITDLKDHNDSDKNLLKHLDYLRSIRNEVQHPEERINQFDAEQSYLTALKIFDIIYH